MRGFKVISRQINDCRLLIVGKGPEEAFLRALAAELGISDRVIFAGYVEDEDLPSYYQLSDVYVLPSVVRIENFGITLLEAMASEKPVIVSDLPGPNEVVEEAINGFLFKPGDFKSLASLLLRVLLDSDACSVMGYQGRLKAEKYTWEKVTSSFLEVYKQFL